MGEVISPERILGISETIFQTLIEEFLQDYFLSISDGSSWEKGLYNHCSQMILDNRNNRSSFSYKEFRGNYSNLNGEEFLSVIDVTFAYSILVNDLIEHWKYDTAMFHQLRKILDELKNKTRNDPVIHRTQKSIYDHPNDNLRRNIVALDAIITFVKKLKVIHSKEEFLWDCLTPYTKNTLESCSDQAYTLMNELNIWNQTDSAVNMAVVSDSDESFYTEKMNFATEESCCLIISCIEIVAFRSPLCRFFTYSFIGIDSMPDL